MSKQKKDSVRLNVWREGKRVHVEASIDEVMFNRIKKGTINILNNELIAPEEDSDACSIDITIDQDKVDYTELIQAIDVLHEGITSCKMYFRDCEYTDALRYEEQEIPILCSKGMYMIATENIKGIIDSSLSVMEDTPFHNHTEVLNVLAEKDVVVYGEFSCQEQPHVLINHGMMTYYTYLSSSSMSYDEFRAIVYVWGFLDSTLNTCSCNDVTSWRNAIAIGEQIVCHIMSLSGEIVAYYLTQSIINEMHHRLRVLSKNFASIGVLDVLKKHDIITDLPVFGISGACYEIRPEQFLRALTA